MPSSLNYLAHSSIHFTFLLSSPSALRLSGGEDDGGGSAGRVLLLSPPPTALSHSHSPLLHHFHLRTALSLQFFTL